MPTIETNLYPITNLERLTAKYRLYRVKGLYPDQDEYHRRCQRLRQTLNRELKTSCGILTRNDEAVLALRQDAPEPPPQTMLGGPVAIEASGKVLPVDFLHRTPETESLALIFLQDLIKKRLRQDRRLWQPDNRALFFQKEASWSGKIAGVHYGFGVRVVPTDDGGLGFCLDAQTKYVALRPLPAELDRRTFTPYKMKNFVYHYGHDWYEVQLSDCPGLSIQEYLCGEADGKKTLFDWVLDHCPQPRPPELAKLDREGAAVEYVTAADEKRGAPAALCYRIFDTTEAEVQREHGRSILVPDDRAYAIIKQAEEHFRDLVSEGKPVTVNSQPVGFELKRFVHPDLRYGHNRVLSVRGTSGATRTELKSLGSARWDLLTDRNAGFFSTHELYQQLVIMPRSVAESWGQEFGSSLQEAVNRLYPQRRAYLPALIVYDDRTGRNFVEQGKALIAAAAGSRKQGFAVAMIHDSPAQRARNGEDMLEAYVRRELSKRGIIASVIHTTAGDAYKVVHRDGSIRCDVKSELRGVLMGYLKNIALCHVLLPNACWPFVLAEPLKADVIIGIDVKDHTAGFVGVGRDGATIKLMPARPSKQKEKLLAAQCRDYVADCVKAVAKSGALLPRSIVIHRDGRIFDSELAGCRQALEVLREEGIVASDAEITFLEIPKHSLAPFRMFELFNKEKGLLRDNPPLGTYYLAGANDAYVCSTGWPFVREGTAQPLHVHRNSGPMPIEQCAADVFALCCLTWTQPKESSRHPITLKLNDRQLTHEAGKFDADLFNFGETSVQPSTR
jgi:hypothetical protein